MMNDEPTLKDLAKMIDHSLLHPAMTDDAIRHGCQTAIDYDVATACIKPYSITIAKDILQDSGVGICAVIAFPHGNSSTAIKVKEAEETVLAGAKEIDMVVNIGKVLSEDWTYVSKEIQAINKVVTANQGFLKVIFENDFLEDKHIIRLCQICSDHEVAFVKTATGYGFVKQPNGMYAYQGATDHHLKLMLEHSGPKIQVKAAGGVRTLDDLLRVRALGVTRIGASATPTIMEEAKKKGIS